MTADPVRQNQIPPGGDEPPSMPFAGPASPLPLVTPPAPEPGGEPRRVSRLHINQLELHLPGVSPSVAEAAARALGPALARALRGRTLRDSAVARLEGQPLTLTHPADANTLATRMAQHLAEQITGD